MTEMMAEMKKEMMAEMNERLSLAEATMDDFVVIKDELAAAKGDMNRCLAKTEDELVAIKDNLANTKDELTATKEELAVIKAKTDELEREVAAPFIHSCGYNGYLSGHYMTIPYTSLLYSSTNTEGGGLDISTGVFTAPHGGSYTVYWDTSARVDSGEDVYIFLLKNGKTIQESEQYSFY